MAFFSLLRHFFSQTTTAPSERGNMWRTQSQDSSSSASSRTRSAHDGSSSFDSSTTGAPAEEEKASSSSLPSASQPGTKNNRGAPAPLERSTVRKSSSETKRLLAFSPATPAPAQPKEPATRPTTATGAAAAVNAPAPASNAPPPTAVAATLVASCTDTEDRRLGGSSKDTCLCSSRSDCETMVQDARQTCEASFRTARTRAS
mmetsp:Transcript_17173/g.48996  ORF Transcript_17173/g.48996 Transcript_17173/m.48996 type:complete len:203 (-) Transcript_17173:683-1291(-)